MIEKILERLEEVVEFENYGKPMIYLEDAQKIVQEVAKEEKEDIDWKRTREYVAERYFKTIMELSEKYDYPCKDIALDFDWVFGLIKKIENCLAKDGGWIPCSERLPQEDEPVDAFCKVVNVTLKNGTMTSGWCNRYLEKWYVLDEEHDYPMQCEYEEVIAWQPLPAPYQKGE